MDIPKYLQIENELKKKSSPVNLNTEINSIVKLN